MSGPRKGARLRATAAEVVSAVTARGRSLDRALADGLAKIPADDHALLKLLSYGSLRNYWQLNDWIAALVSRPLKARDNEIHALLAAGLYQLSDTRIPDHAVVSQTVEAARLLQKPKLAPLVNAVLRRARRDRIFERPASNEEAQWNHPGWLLERLRSDWPDDWRAIATANNERAPMWIRVNRQVATAAEYLERLRDADIDATPLPGAADALRLETPLPVEQLPGFDAGHVSVQDAAAQLAAPWLLGGVEGRVLDACAAPGGKSGHLLELAAGKIDLSCIDNDEVRLQRVAANLNRLNANATHLLADASKPEDWWDRQPYAAILLDAPCSATGVIRRHPDIKHLRRPSDIEALADTQFRMLSALWPLLAPGGRLLYVTCSVLTAENDAVVERFIGDRNDVQEDNVLHNNNIRDLMRDKTCGVQILPGTAALDGFYYAGLVKVS